MVKLTMRRNVKYVLLLTILPWFTAFGNGIAQAAEIPIDQQHKEFLPNSITIKTGDTLLFLNHDSRIHNILVVDPDGQATDEGLQKPDITIKHTFTAPGKYEVRCAIHPEMILTVTVQ